MSKFNFMVLWFTLFLAGIRFTIIPRLDLPTAVGSYEAFAHLWAGGLFGAAIAFRICRNISQARQCFSTYNSECQFWSYEKSCWILGTSISLLELVMFLIQKFL